MEAAEALLGGAAAVLLDLRLALDPLRVVAGEAHCPQEEEQFVSGPEEGWELMWECAPQLWA